MEAELSDQAWARGLQRGRSHAELQKQIPKLKLHQLAAMALYGDPKATGQRMNARLNAMAPKGKELLRQIQNGAHGRLDDRLDVHSLLSRTQSMVEALQVGS